MSADFAIDGFNLANLAPRFKAWLSITRRFARLFRGFDR